MSASEQPISRVNYFNGQRLEAADFRAEQDYQIAVRRKLYSSLYSVGIVQGLEVTKHPTDPHKVVVAPGVALDFLGREIILLDPTEVIAAGTPTTNPAAIFGNYLVISYAEQRVLPVSDGCTAGNGACGGNLAWGATTRILAQPALQFTDTFPTPRSGQIVLAQVALLGGCQVGKIEAGIRQYAVPAKPPTTRPISLEGEKDIDGNNPKTLYFHIDGGVPNTVTLFLRAARFSTLFYTELGAHTHDNKFAQPNITIADHDHGFKSIITGTATQDATKPPTLLAWTWNDAIDVAIRMNGTVDGHRRVENLTLLNPIGDGTLCRLDNLSEHTHSIPAGTTDKAGGQVLSLGTLNNAPTGLLPAARTSTVTPIDHPLSFVENMKVLYDGQDITDGILHQLANTDGTNWPDNTPLGNGKDDSPLVIKGDRTGGAGPIFLEQLGLDFSPGRHSLKFQVNSGGGQIQYNLYVE